LVNIGQLARRDGKSAHRFRISPTARREVRARLTDVVMPEPPLNRRERDAGIHPS